jgi:hypothetical protein
MHKAWLPAGPCAANRAARLLSTLFNYAIKRTDSDWAIRVRIDLFPERLKRGTGRLISYLHGGRR